MVYCNHSRIQARVLSTCPWTLLWIYHALHVAMTRYFQLLTDFQDCADLFPASPTSLLSKQLNCFSNIGFASLGVQKRSSLIVTPDFKVSFGDHLTKLLTHVWLCQRAITRRRTGLPSASTGVWSRSCVATRALSNPTGADCFPRLSLHWILRCKTATVKFPFRLCLEFNL